MRPLNTSINGPFHFCFSGRFGSVSQTVLGKFVSEPKTIHEKVSDINGDWELVALTFPESAVSENGRWVSGTPNVGE